MSNDEEDIFLMNESDPETESSLPVFTQQSVPIVESNVEETVDETVDGNVVDIVDDNVEDIEASSNEAFTRLVVIQDKPSGIKRKASEEERKECLKKKKDKKRSNNDDDDDDDDDENDKDDDDDGSYCTICFETWTNSGDHRISSLKCGHFFGFICIDKWLKTGKSCPNCNEKACRRDVRTHYVSKLKAIDTSEKDRALSELEAVKVRLRQLELDYVTQKVANRMQGEEIERLKKELSKVYSGLAPSMVVPTPPTSSASSLKWVYQKRIEILKDSSNSKFGCRVMSYDSHQAMLVLSQPSFTVLAPGYGVKRINVLDLNQNIHSFVGLHKEQIRDLQFNPVNHDQLLSVSQDKTIKLTNISSCVDIQRYICESEVWSCEWNLDNPYEFFVGTKRSQILLYDIRSSDGSPKMTLEFPIVERRPIIGLAYVPERPNHESFRPGGLLVQTLGSLWFFRREPSGTEFTAFQLPISGLFWSLRLEPESRMILVSTKPSPCARHIAATLTQVTVSEDAPLASVSAIVVMDHGRGGTYAEKSFLRTALIPRVDSVFAVYSRGSGNTDHKVVIQEIGSDRIIQELPVSKPILDICLCPVNDMEFLVLLSETELFIYKWT